MNAFTNLKIAYKIAALMLMLGAVTLGIAFTGLSSIRSVDKSYSHLTDVVLPNNTELARAYQGVIDMSYSAYQVMAYPGGSAEGNRAAEREKESYDAAVKRLRDIAKEEPEAASTIDALVKQIDELDALNKAAIAFGRADRNDEARVALAQADTKAGEIRTELRRFTNERASAATEQAKSLTESSHAAATTPMVPKAR